LKIAGFLLLLAGWIITLSAIALLTGPWVLVFLLAGIAVELIGSILLSLVHRPLRSGNGNT